jgi:CHAT domain-containing protein
MTDEVQGQARQLMAEVQRPGEVSDRENLRLTVSAEPVEMVESGESAKTGWKFVMTCPQAPGFRITREARLDDASGSMPLPTRRCDHEPRDWCLGDDGQKVAAAVRDLGRRRGSGGVAVGHVLFSALLGDDWPKVGKLAHEHHAARVELALIWPEKAAALNRLPWELMHDGERYLSTSGGDVAVTVTRVVTGTRHAMRELSVPPRVLFAVGAKLTDAQIRPGTEMLSVLREIRAAGRRIDHRILDRATPRRLGQAVASYHPEIVHFICHGGETANGDGYLRLLSDDAPDGTVDVTAAQLLEHLRVKGVAPPAVVLSACDTAGALASGWQPSLGGPELTAPLAVDLVRAGVAVVVAMAGTVADRTCRIFTRTFGAAMAAGESLVTATAEARRFAFAETPGTAGVDWAMPAVFFSAGVDPDDVHYTEDRGRMLVDRWLGGLTEGKPVFCAREAFFDTYWAMLSAGNGDRSGWERDDRTEPIGSLVIAADDSKAGLGKTRLLEEFQRAALASGHLPLLVGSSNEEGPPSDVRRFVVALGQAFGDLTMDVLGLGPRHGRQLITLGRKLADPSKKAELAQDVMDALEYFGEGHAFKAALQENAAGLLEAARKKYPDVFTEASRVVVLVDDLGRQSVPLLTALIERKLLTNYGFGNGERLVPVIPVVLTVRFENEQDIRRRLYESNDRSSLGVLHLTPFDANTEEDLLAYERVLLHPFWDRGPDNLKKRWVFARDLDDDRWKKWTGHLRNLLEGTPARFHDRVYVATLEWGVDGNYLKAASDEDEWERGGAA